MHRRTTADGFAPRGTRADGAHLAAIVTLTTDFGQQDYYVGAVKGTILRIVPEALIVDLCHAIPAQDVLAGAFLLQHAAGEFPTGSVHLAVVDPGVGTQRRALAVAARGHIWVGPDNGLLSFALRDSAATAYQIEDRSLFKTAVSATFHGRDLFAPVAARLAAGLPIERVGGVVSDPAVLEETLLVQKGARIWGQIIHVDRFGNLITNISRQDVATTEPARVTAGRATLPIVTTYADVHDGRALALFGSCDLLEVSVNGGNAAVSLQLNRRDPILVEWG